MPTQTPSIRLRAEDRRCYPLVAVAWVLAVCLVLCWVTIPECATAEAEAEAGPPAIEVSPFFAALSVASAEVSGAWYGRVLGFEETRRVEWDGGLIVLLERPGAILEVVEDRAARPRSGLQPPVEKISHLHGVFKLGFRVEDLDTAIQRLEDLGVPLRGRVITEEHGSSRSLQLEDPDGNVLQLFEILKSPPAQ